MSRITLSGSMPQETTNGLAPHGKDFIENPRVLVPVVALVAVQKVTIKPETGESYPTLRIHHWEIVGSKGTRAHAKMLGDALAARTGIVELPFEAGAEIPLKQQQDPFPEDEDFGGRLQALEEDKDGDG